MKNIFWGLLFVFLDFNLDLGSSRIGLIPDFIGYILIINGLNELSSKNNWFLKSKPYSIGMMIYTGIIYILDVFSISGSLGIVTNFILGLISTIITLYISYNIIMGIKAIEITEFRQLKTNSLYSSWKLLAIASIATFALLWIPYFNIITIIINLIINIYFLITFSKTKNLYYSTSIMMT